VFAAVFFCNSGVWN